MALLEVGQATSNLPLVACCLPLLVNNKCQACVFFLDSYWSLVVSGSWWRVRFCVGHVYVYLLTLVASAVVAVRRWCWRWRRQTQKATSNQNKFTNKVNPKDLPKKKRKTKQTRRNQFTLTTTL